MQLYGPLNVVRAHVLRVCACPSVACGQRVEMCAWSLLQASLGTSFLEPFLLRPNIARVLDLLLAFFLSLAASLPRPSSSRYFGLWILCGVSSISRTPLC